VLLGNYAIIEAHRDVELSAVSPFRYSIIIWAVALGITVFGEWPTPLALGGIVLIGASGMYTLHRERIRSRIETARPQSGSNGTNTEIMTKNDRNLPFRAR